MDIVFKTSSIAFTITFEVFVLNQNCFKTEDILNFFYVEIV
jgi:hypothetical protein